MAAAQADRAKSADCNAHLGPAAAWAGAAAAAVEALGGVAIKSIGSNELVLELAVVVPTSLAAGDWGRGARLAWRRSRPPRMRMGTYATNPDCAGRPRPAACAHGGSSHGPAAS